MDYPIKNFHAVDERGVQNDLGLMVHLCHPFAATEDMVELCTDGVVILTQEEFEKFVVWVRGEFARLSKITYVVQ